VQPRVKLWLEKDGLLVFSDYRAELLDHIAKTGSISAGAERMGLSYRRAWGKIKEIEHNLGVRLVRSEAAGEPHSPRRVSNSSRATAPFARRRNRTSDGTSTRHSPAAVSFFVGSLCRN